MPLTNRVLAAAELAHEVNRAYCEAIGDYTQVLFKISPDWQQESAVMGVLKIATGDTKKPSDSHESWLAQKEADGWKYGPVKDPEKKEHHCMVPFHELPASQQAKDHLFFHTVTTFLSTFTDMEFDKLFEQKG